MLRSLRDVKASERYMGELIKDTNERIAAGDLVYEGAVQALLGAVYHVGQTGLEPDQLVMMLRTAANAVER